MNELCKIIKDTEKARFNFKQELNYYEKEEKYNTENFFGDNWFAYSSYRGGRLYIQE